MSLGVNTVLNLYGLCKAKYKIQDSPLDGNKVMKDGRKMLGTSTTVIGLGVCIILSLIMYICSHDLFLFFGPLLVYLGHTLGSFTKRRLGKGDGEFVPIIDHGDSIIILSIAALLFGRYSVTEVLIAIIIVLVLQPLLTFVAFKLKLREKPL